MVVPLGQQYTIGENPPLCCTLTLIAMQPVAPVAQRHHVTSDTFEREFDSGKRDFSH